MLSTGNWRCARREAWASALLWDPPSHQVVAVTLKTCFARRDTARHGADTRLVVDMAAATRVL